MGLASGAGIVLVVVGTIAIGMPLSDHTGHSAHHRCFTAIGGCCPAAWVAFWTRDWSGFFLMLLMGVLYIVLGLLFVRQPIRLPRP